MTEKTPKEKTIATQYAELNRFGQLGEYERALKAANKILGLAANEFLAFHSKIVCFIHLSKFEEAITLINKNPQYAKDLIFEKAYCCYRANRHEEALKAISQSEDEVDLRIKELKAQILYRLEEFKAAAQLYQEIIKNTDDEYEDERHTNLVAVMANLEEDERDNDVEEFKDKSYEMCFNKACVLISNGQYNDAEKKLRQCEILCREYFEEDDVTEEEIDIELALIRIQLGFVYHKQGRIKEAHQLYSSNLKVKSEDVALMAVASNNVVCINKDQNLFDSKKKMKVALNDSLVYKLPSKQRKFIALNNAIFNYYINQTDQCEKACKFIDENWPELSINTTVIKALNLFKNEKTKEAIDLLSKTTTENKTDKLYINLCLVQLHLMKGQKLEACKILENLGEDSYKPAVVGALTTLYLGIGDEETALKVFAKTVDWYRKNKVKSVDLSSLWRQAADFHIRNGHPQVAANSLEELLQANKNDKKVTAQLILACSQFDKKRALQLSTTLPSVKELSKGLDIENLQVFTSAVSYKKSPAVKPDSHPGTPHTEDSQKKTRKHKKRKGKLPKNYDPKVGPDPERWLPRYERSGYRKKRDRRAKDVIKGSQGTSSTQAEQYDFSKYVDEQQAESSPSSSNVDPSPRLKSGVQFPQKKAQQKRKNKRR